MKPRISIILFIFFLISSKSFACDCKDSKSLKEIQNIEFNNSKYVFIGEVLKIDAKKYTFKIKVIESFKGVLSGKVYTGIYNEFCSPLIDKTGKWLVYANRTSKGLIEIRVCGITRSFKNPENNLSATKPPNPPASKQTTFQNKKRIIEWKTRARLDLENEIYNLRIKIK